MPRGTVRWSWSEGLAFLIYAAVLLYLQAMLRQTNYYVPFTKFETKASEVFIVSFLLGKCQGGRKISLWE